MSLDKKSDKKITKGAIGRKKKIQSTEGTAGPELVSKIAETSISLGEVVQRLKKEHNINVTIPTVTTYLQMQWGKEYGDKKKEMSLRRSKVKRWKTEYGLARQGIADKFYEDYISTDDGVFYNWGTMDDIFSKNELESLPRVEDRAYKGKDIINYSKEGKFGWKADPTDPDALGTVNHSSMSIMTLQLRNRIEGLVEEKKRKLIQEETRKRLEDYAYDNRETLTSEDIPKVMRDITKEVRVELKPELVAMDGEVEEKLLDVLAKLGKGDARTRILHGKEIYNKKLDPAYASSDKKWRGRQRMVSMPDKIFSRSVYNLPFLLWMHPKRVQVHSHNLSKKLPELLKPEEPKVKAEYNDVPGINGNVRFPRNVAEHVQTQEAGMIVTEDFAKKFRYFTVVEEGTLIADTKVGFPTAPRINKNITNYKDYKKETDIIEGTYPVDRLDPLTLGGFSELGVGVGNKFAKHSGELFLVGDSKERKRKITLAQGESGDDTREVVYYSQDYQIVREDELKVADKLLDRGGLKGIVSDIVPSLGINPKNGKPYDLVCNYDEVWRETDRSTAEGRLDDDRFHKQGKKKSAIVREHEEGNGEIFFFMIDKFAQDSTTTGLSFSPTLVSGLWEWALDGLEMNTEEARNNLIDSFATEYFRGRGNLVPTLKALHYKAVKKDGIVALEIDDAEPTADEHGEIIDLPHTYAGNTYQKAYVPHSVARVYFDGATFREVYISQLDKTPNDASDFYWFNVMKQAKNRFGLFPKMDWGIQLVTRPWAEDPKDPTKYHKVQMDYLDVIDMGGDPFDPNLTVTFRKEPVTGKESIQTHPVEVDFSAKVRGSIGLNPTVALAATIDYDGDCQIKDSVIPIKMDAKWNRGEILLPTVEEIFEWYKDEAYELDGREFINLEDKDFKILTGKYYTAGPKAEFYRPKYIMRMKAKKLYAIRDGDRGIPVVTENHSVMVNGEGKTLEYFRNVDDFNIDTTDNLYTVGALSNGEKLDVIKEINVSDFVEKVEGIPEKIQLTHGFGYLCGSYLSDGSGNGGTLVSGVNFKHVKKVYLLAKELFDTDAVDYSFTNGDKRFEIKIPLGRVAINSNIMQLFVNFLGLSFDTKHLPNDIFRMPNDFIRGLIRGYLKGDGTEDDFDWHLRSGGFASSSRKLASQLVFLLKYKFDAKNFRYKCKVKENGKLHYDISWNNDKNMRNQSKMKDMIYEIDYDDYVYDFEVPETHTFIDALGNVVLHNTVVAFVPAIKDAVVKLDEKQMNTLKEWKTKKFDEKFEDLYSKARKLTYAKDEAELGLMCAAYNQQIAETESELIERLGGLRKRAMILQGKQAPPVVTIGEGTKYEEQHTMDIALINQISDVEKILKMKEPRWKVKRLEKKPIESLDKEEWELVRDSYLRKELTKLVNDVIKDKGVKKLYDLLREPSDYMKKEFVTKSGYEGDPIGLKIDTESRLLDRILYNELRESDIYSDLDER